MRTGDRARHDPASDPSLKGVDRLAAAVLGRLLGREAALRDVWRERRGSAGAGHKARLGRRCVALPAQSGRERGFRSGRVRPDQIGAYSAAIGNGK